MGTPYDFDPEALGSNAAGRLTDAQHAMFKQGSWQMRWLPLLSGDLRRREVRAVEGGIRKVRPLDTAQSTEATGTPRYALEVDGLEFDVPSQRVWEAAPEVGYVRLYYLPRSRTAVNLEMLPDPPVSSSPDDVVRAVGEGLRSALVPGLTRRGRASRTERAAHANAVVKAAMAGGSPQPGVAGSEAAGGGPVAEEDLAGVWTSAFFTVEVRPDGTLTLRDAQGVDQQGRWRVDPSGLLHVRFDSDLDGGELTTPLAVTGDQMHLELGGQLLNLQRSR